MNACMTGGTQSRRGEALRLGADSKEIGESMWIGSPPFNAARGSRVCLLALIPTEHSTLYTAHGHGI